MDFTTLKCVVLITLLWIVKISSSPIDSEETPKEVPLSTDEVLDTVLSDTKEVKRRLADQELLADNIVTKLDEVDRRLYDVERSNAEIQDAWENHILHMAEAWERLRAVEDELEIDNNTDEDREQYKDEGDEDDEDSAEEDEKDIHYEEYFPHYYDEIEDEEHYLDLSKDREETYQY